MSWTDGKSVEEDVAEEERQARGAEWSVLIGIFLLLLWAAFRG
jgi:hypothetical protein